MSVLNLTVPQIKALNALPTTEPRGLGEFTIASLNKLVDLGLAETETTKNGETKFVITKLGRAAKAAASELIAA